MCRSIKTLRPPYQEEVTADDIEAASVQYVRKISGFRKPSKANEQVFNLAVRQVAKASQKLLDTLDVHAAVTGASKN
ncbi:MAG: DUF2277 domain-containing protein [Chloroflexi bacterium]|nr:DUF2277 domain-containing protein [Chloroflexota bacterium]